MKITKTIKKLFVSSSSSTSTADDAAAHACPPSEVMCQSTAEEDDSADLTVTGHVPDADGCGGVCPHSRLVPTKGGDDGNRSSNSNRWRPKRVQSRPTDSFQEFQDFLLSDSTGAPSGGGVGGGCGGG